MDQRMRDLETLLHQLLETPAFAQLGDPEGETFTWPKAPAEGALKWPVVRVSCPAGHEVALINLTFDRSQQSWMMQSDSAAQAVPAWEGNRYAGNVVSLERTVFQCQECQRKSQRKQALPVTGARLLCLYAEAVIHGKTSFRLG